MAVSSNLAIATDLPSWAFYHLIPLIYIWETLESLSSRQYGCGQRICHWYQKPIWKRGAENECTFSISFLAHLQPLPCTPRSSFIVRLQPEPCVELGEKEKHSLPGITWQGPQRLSHPIISSCCFSLPTWGNSRLNLKRF